MNDILKQRLVGALILLALGVVFWPIIFVEPGDPAVGERERIPPRPAVDTTPVEAPDMAGLRPSPDIRAARERDAQQAVPEPAPVAPEIAAAEEAERTAATAEARAIPAAPPAQRTRTEAPQKLVMDSDGVPVAWMLQVASVSSAEKADELRRQLLARHHKAYVKRIRRGDKSLYRVYIGPKFERAQLERVQGEIDAEFGVHSLIARYVP